MSSQTLATSLPGGLPPSPPPAPDLPDYSPPAWTDHVDAPEQPLDHSHFSHPDPPQDRPSSSRPSHSNTSEQHRQALNNLLAALAPIHASNSTPTNLVNGLPASEPAQANAPTVSQDENNQAAVTQNNQVTNLLQSTLPEDCTPFPPSSGDPALLPPLPQGLPPFPPNFPDLSALNPPLMPSQPPALSINDRREIEAFAKIEFEDGNYYITTWACELGRDALAFRAALQRAEEAKNNPNGPSQSSSGRVSRPSDRVRRPGDSQVQGSVISEAGGFGGVDEGPVVRSDEKPAESGHPSHSSQVSASDVVKPQEVLYHPPLAPFDYHRNAELQAQLNIDDEQPAPVTAEHLPNADTCPLIPIHAMANATKSEVATHKGISRRHVRIEWDWESECFKMKVLGRNGAFLDGAFVGRGVSKRLTTGAKIQISDIQMTFRLPRPKTEPVSEDSDRDEREGSALNRRSTSPTSNDADETPAKGSKRARVSFTNKTAATPNLTDPVVGPDGQPIAPRKRGPGRPPKDGIMSTRERKERERAAKMAEAKAANGGKTPPPLAKGKMPKLPETPVNDPKPDKRKYTKRKREGEDGEVLPSIEGGEENVPSDTEKVPVKKARASKSPSPEYPPLPTLTEEQLARPSEPYARLIYDILAEIHPKALPLKQIYRALKMKFPFFVYRVESEGWQSSVRHNLNQEWNKLFEKGEKEGKGFAWKAIPGALQPQAERKRAAQAAAAAKPKPTPRPPPQQQGPPPPLNWQNNASFQPPFWPQGQGPYPPPPNGMPWPPPPGQGPPPRPPSMPLQGPIPGTPQNASPMPQQPPRGLASNLPAQPHGHPPPQLPQQPPPTFPASASTSAAPNMPCTLDGLMAIRRFETAMYEQVARGPNPNLEQWRLVFASVKNRLLHGAISSTMPGGETKEETTILGHVRTFIERFRNTNFVGFGGLGSEAGSRTASPAPAVMSGLSGLSAPALAPTSENGSAHATAVGSTPAATNGTHQLAHNDAATANTLATGSDTANESARPEPASDEPTTAPNNTDAPTTTSGGTA